MKKLIIITLMTSVMCLSANHLAAQTSTPEYTQWYVGVSAGASVADNDESIPNMIGIQGAYFFNQKFGVGLVVRKCNASMNFPNLKLNFSDEHFFVGASFFANWGRSDSKLFFPTRIGLGTNKCSSKNNWTGSFTETLFGAHASAGIAYRVSNLISFGVNAEWAFPFEYVDYTELLGINVGVSFHF